LINKHAPPSHGVAHEVSICSISWTQLPFTIATRKKKNAGPLIKKKNGNQSLWGKSSVDHERAVCVLADVVAMNGYIIISLENGLMLFTQTKNNYGLQERKDPLEISSYLYAIYSLSKSYYEDDFPGEDGNVFNGVMSGLIATSFRESPLSYFQQVLPLSLVIDS
jgi:hypothetical protein